MGDEETNQLEDGDYSMDEDDDDIGALLGNPPNGRLANGSLPTVTVTSASSVSQTTVKKAVDFFDEDEETESRAHSASTSSGRSTQKDSSPFFVDHDSDSKKDAPRSSSSPPPVIHEEPMDTIGSPLGHSTRLDETYIEEHSIDLDVSFDKSVFHFFSILLISGNVRKATFSQFRHDESSQIQEIKPIPNNQMNGEVKQVKEVKRNKTPFDDDIDHLGGGTLSGRDPFMEEELAVFFQSSSSVSEKREKARKSLQSVNSIMGSSGDFDPDIPKPQPRPTHQPLQHKFSSSDEDIVHARIDDEDEVPVAPRRRSYFDEIVEVQEEVQKSELDTTWKRPSKPEEKPTPSTVTSAPGTSQVEDSTSSRSKSKEAAVPGLFDEEDAASEREDLDRTHVDAVVIT
ncbi:hypothetical protein ANCCAN_06842, partial [Ancylostoma caninum]